MRYWALIITLLLANSAGANPVEVRWRNPGPSRAYDAVEVCQGATCRAYPAPCGPGLNCSAVVDLPRGTRETWLHARDGATRSAESNRRALQVPAVCRDYDADASGTITVSDFGVFLQGLGTVWTVADFGGLLATIGRACP